jgi:hypothetical protein
MPDIIFQHIVSCSSEDPVRVDTKKTSAKAAHEHPKIIMYTLVFAGVPGQELAAGEPQVAHGKGRRLDGLGDLSAAS